MSLLYMIFWSIVMTIVLGWWRLRNWGQRLVVFLVTALILLFSQTLFIQLSIAAGVNPGSVFSAPGDFLLGGPFGWLALLVMPCGWLGPIVGVNLVQRWNGVTHP